MKPNSLFHISGGVVKIDQVTIYNDRDKKSNENEQKEEAEDEEKEEAEDEDHTDVVEVQPISTREDNQPGIIRFFAQRSKAQPILSWLHETTDDSRMRCFSLSCCQLPHACLGVDMADLDRICDMPFC